MDTLPLETLDNFSDLYGDIYVERNTSLLYEVKHFDSFVIVRPASPAFYSAIRKLSYVEFTDEFDEYCGDHKAIHAHLHGLNPELVIE